MFVVSQTCSKNNTLVIVPDTVLWFTAERAEGIIFYGLATSHIFLSVWMVAEYFGVNWPHFVVRGLLGAIVPRFIWRFM